MKIKPKQSPAAPQARKPQSNQPDRVHAAIQSADRARAQHQKAMREMYEHIDQHAREIGLTNITRLDQVPAITRQRTDQIKAAWSKATGGAPRPPELDKHLKEYIADTQTQTAPLADAARLELSTKAAGLTTPFEKEDQRRNLIKEKEKTLADSRWNGKQSWSGRTKERIARDEQYRKIRTRATQLRDKDPHYVQTLISEGLCKKIGWDGEVLDEDMSDRQVSRIINPKSPKKSRQE